MVNDFTQIALPEQLIEKIQKKANDFKTMNFGEEPRYLILDEYTYSLLSLHLFKLAGLKVNSLPIVDTFEGMRIARVCNTEQFTIEVA